MPENHLARYLILPLTIRLNVFDAPQTSCQNWQGYLYIHACSPSSNESRTNKYRYESAGPNGFWLPASII